MRMRNSVTCVSPGRTTSGSVEKIKLSEESFGACEEFPTHGENRSDYSTRWAAMQTRLRTGVERSQDWRRCRAPLCACLLDAGQVSFTLAPAALRTPRLCQPKQRRWRKHEPR